MRIRTVSVNNRKKCIEIETMKGRFGLPFSKLVLKPTLKDRITEIYVDPELANQGITYKLRSGKEDSVPLDAFLDYNRDPDFMRDLALYYLSVEAQKAMEASGLSKHEVLRRLQTSPSQLYRLLDQANYRKSIDEMLRLLTVLGCEVKWNVVKAAA